MFFTCSNWASGMLGHGQAPIGICNAGLIACSIPPCSVPQMEPLGKPYHYHHSKANITLSKSQCYLFWLQCH